ncbi:MAG: HipA N-terminal domain-containing protein [Chitinophagaceae bacterium]|jgi:serine/threonine-protein kinase HipA|nr:HipA N-terminal domain-containing protein [Chitinophagaceae bacterium]
MTEVFKSAQVLYNHIPAGILSKTGNRYRFNYYPDYLAGAGNRPVSVTLPLSDKIYESEILFPAFVNMLSEGANKRIQCRMLKIDENDYFSLLLATAKDDNIGPITIKPIHEPT